jgi:hypothetical protein
VVETAGRVNHEPIRNHHRRALIGGLIALSIMLTNHWTLTPGPVLLNRWTGVVVACERDAKEGMRCPPPTTQR